MIKSIKKISKKHYIQCGLAVLLTGLVLYFTSALWYSKAVIVSFNAEAKKEIQYQVFYLEANGQNFNEKRSVRKKIKSGNQKVEILLPIEKIVKIRLDIGSNPGNVIISDLQIKGSRSIKLNYNEFNKNQIDKFEVKNGKLYLTSNQGDPYLPYKNELNLPAGYQVDWCRLIIISVLSFLLMYKFVQYLSKFKIEKHHSRIDIVMLAVFFALLFVPMSHISDAEKSEQENRMLAKKPQLTIDNKVGNNYGVQFDAWYNDHFFGRDAMIYLYNYMKFFISPNGENDKAMIGKNGFLWGKNYNAIDMYRNNNLFTNEELEVAGKHISKFVKDAKASGIKNVYFMLSNDKESMYPEYYPSYIKKVGKVSRLEQLLSYIHKSYPQIKFLNFRDKFEDIKKENIVFCKTGTHMNMIGSFYEYYFLVNEIKKDYPKLNVLTLKDFDIKISDDINQHGLDLDIYKKFFILPRYSKDNFRNKILSLKLKLVNQPKSVRTSNNLFTRGINEKVQNKIKVFNIGDSFSGGYYAYLLLTFYEADRVFIGGGLPFVLYPNEIKYLYDNIPDIIIVETTERFLQRFLTLEFPKNPNSSAKEN